MKVSWKIEKVERGGLLGSKTKFSVFAKLDLDPEEAALVADYSPYDPPISDFVELNSVVDKTIFYNTASSYTGGPSVEFDTIQRAGKYKDGLIEAFEKYKTQIDAASTRVASLGVLHEVEL